jgi:hypothetical protein
MDTSLKDFVKQVLLDITEAVEEAKEQAPVAIAPGTVGKDIQMKPQLVEFDISVSSRTKNTQRTRGGGSATLVSIIRAEVGSEKTNDSHLRETNRIKFSVPVYFQAYLQRHAKFMK